MSFNLFVGIVIGCIIGGLGMYFYLNFLKKK